GREDKDVADALRRVLADEGVDVRTRTTIERIEGRRGSLVVHVRTADGPAMIEASDVFVATGRQPNTSDLGLETLGVEVDDHGIVRGDERLATSVPGVWAAGDIRGGPQFTHTSWDDHRVLLSQLTGDGRRTTRRIVPYAVFTDPELGRVGMTESEARAAGI